MDVMRVDTKDGHHRYAMCTACYGYMGDLMHTSEGLRWLGPSRYNLAGRPGGLLASCLALGCKMLLHGGSDAHLRGPALAGALALQPGR